MNYLLVDIATSAQPDIESSPYLSWANKKGAMTAEDAYSKAGMHPEYSIICGISLVEVSFNVDGAAADRAGRTIPKGYKIGKTVSWTALDLAEEEEQILLPLERMLEGKEYKIVGHNAKDFIVPFLAKRYLANGLAIPSTLYKEIKEGPIDIMKELSCGGVSVMSLRAAAWMLGVKDPRSSIKVPRYYELAKEGKTQEIEMYTSMNAETAADIFVDCVLGGLIKV